jgi:alkylated DNA repair dioxygenase AlkB
MFILPLYKDVYAPVGSVTRLETEISWENVQSARGECFMSDETKEYQYIKDGPVYTSVPFHPMVKGLMEQLNNDFGYNMNVCFLNYYSDHTKALGWHSDDSPPIDQSQPICVISLGQPREIWWKFIGAKGIVPAENKQLLSDGSLFIMPPGMQDIYCHKIPKGDRQMTTRISLTYRSWKAGF